MWMFLRSRKTYFKTDTLLSAETVEDGREGNTKTVRIQLSRQYFLLFIVPNKVVENLPSDTFSVNGFLASNIKSHRAHLLWRSLDLNVISKSLLYFPHCKITSQSKQYDKDRPLQGIFDWRIRLVHVIESKFSHIRIGYIFFE